MLLFFGENNLAILLCSTKCAKKERKNNNIGETCLMVQENDLA